MKALSKLGLLLAVSLLGVAALASSAHAQTGTIGPDETLVEGLSGDSTLTYGSATVACDTATANGETGTDQVFVDLELTFTDNCNISGLAATVTCTAMDPDTGDGGVRLSVLPGTTTDEGTVDLNPNFRCDIVVPGVCTVTVNAGAGGINLPDATSSADLDEAADTLDANVDVPATRTGSTLCGPASGTGNFSGLYATTPPDLEVH
jgi:hypothetical protein